MCGPLGAALGGIPVAFAEDCVGEPAERAVGALKPGEVLLLENLRFHAGEEKNDPAFADQLARLGELYVDDAFSAAHRAHASITGLASRLPSAAGRLMQAEVEALSRALEAPDRPVAALVGGAKISTKLELLGNLIEKVDLLILGGGMANTFLYAQGTPVGRSLCEKDMADDRARGDGQGRGQGLPDPAADRRPGGERVQGGRRLARGADRAGARRRHDPRRRLRQHAG